MNLITTAIQSMRTKRRERRLAAAHKIITDAGLFVCRFEQVAGTVYIIDGNGTRFKIGRGK